MPELVVALLLAVSGCAEYVPRMPGAPLVIAGDHYYKEGVAYERDFLRSDLVALTGDVPVANAYARTARTRQIEGVVADVISVVTALGTIPAAIVDPKSLNGVTANVLINTSLVFAAVGPILHFLSANRELDAVNAYNDARVTGSESSRGAGPTEPLPPPPP